MELARECAGVAGINRQCAPQRPRKIDDVDEEVVEPEQQEACPCEQGEFGRGPTNHLREVHARDERLNGPSKVEEGYSVHDGLLARIIQNRAIRRMT